jgi:hypothetical protein
MEASAPCVQSPPRTRFHSCHDRLLKKGGTRNVRPGSRGGGRREGEGEGRGVSCYAILSHPPGQ